MRMKVKVFDEDHEEDLELEVNRFLEQLEDTDIVDIKYQVAITTNDEDEQIYCFSALIMYRV